jgi:glycosyltransferase involved in cell wall biosynthesis
MGVSVNTTNHFSCIIPFYNEGNQLITILKTISSISLINQIICVDDGSTNNLSQIIKDKFPLITLISLHKNSGKTKAILNGLKRAENNNIFLIDADLDNVKKKEIENALKSFIHHKDIDLIILKRIDIPLHCKVLRWDVLFSGERIIRKKDLHEVLKESLTGYQIELAVNRYMQRNAKKVYWMPSSGINYWKVKRRGLIKGLFLELMAGINIYSYIGLRNYIWQSIFFCKKELI